MTVLSTQQTAVPQRKVTGCLDSDFAPTFAALLEEAALKGDATDVASRREW